MATVNNESALGCLEIIVDLIFSGFFGVALLVFPCLMTSSILSVEF
jgi:hypothetical protein